MAPMGDVKMENVLNEPNQINELRILFELAGLGSSVGSSSFLPDGKLGGELMIPPDNNVHEIYRHVDSSRLHALLLKLDLKSLLYSPVFPVSVFSSDVFVSDNASLRKIKSMGSCDELKLQSLSHKWTMYGHRYLNIEETIQPCPVYCLILSGTYIISGADDGLVKIWDLSLGTLLATLLGHCGEICELVFASNGGFIASLCSEDHSVVLWTNNAAGTSYVYLRRYIELNLQDPTRKLTPMYLSFTHSDVYLVIAYSNGTVVVHETESGNEWGRHDASSGMELKSFSLVDEQCVENAFVECLVGFGKPKSLLSIRIHKGGDSNVFGYSFPVHVRAPISQISCANSCARFVASDDESSSVALYTSKSAVPNMLMTGLLTGDAVLSDGSSALSRIEEWTGKTPQSRKITVDISAWTLDDKYILSSISCVKEECVGLHCVLIFSVDSGVLVGAIAQHTDSIYNIVPLVSRNGTSFFATAGHDGLFTVQKIYTTCCDDKQALYTEQLTSFNLNFENLGANFLNSILDCQSKWLNGHLFVAISDSNGSVWCFSTCSNDQRGSLINRGFFHNDYTPVGGFPLAGIESGGTRTTMRDTGGVLTDHRLSVRDVFSQIGSETESPPLRMFFPHMGGYLDRFVTKPPTMMVPSKFVPLELPPTNAPADKARRADSLRMLVAARETIHTEPTRTASGRVVRNVSAAIHEDEFDLYQNSEIDDETYDSDDSSSSSVDERLPTRRSLRNANRDESRQRGDARGRGRPRNPPEPFAQSHSEIVPIKLRSDVYVSGSCVETVCTLCLGTVKSTTRLLGPFPVADFTDCYFHEECLFTMTGLSICVSSVPISFGNLDSLVHLAKTQNKCFYCRKLGASITCVGCTRKFHYTCSRASAVTCGLTLDPVYDSIYICSRCELPEEAKGLEIFSRRKIWRSKPITREWLQVGRMGYVPQIGDLVYFYPPAIGEGLVGSVLDSTLFALTDLAMYTWKSDGESPISAKVEEIVYVFPSFFDFEMYALVQKIRLSTGQHDVPDLWIHYRPKTNGSDYLVLKSRVDSALSTNIRLDRGDTVIIPIEGGDCISGTISKIVNQNKRPGWECFQVRDDDGEFFWVSLWEIDLPVEPLNVWKASKFIHDWIRAISTGEEISVGRRPRIQIPPGMDVFTNPPWESASNYLEEIEYPIFLNLILNRIESSFYHSIESLKSDIVHLHTNCVRFNDPDSQLVKYALLLVQTLFTLIELPTDDQHLCKPPQVNTKIEKVINLGIVPARLPVMEPPTQPAHTSRHTRPPPRDRTAPIVTRIRASGHRDSSQLTRIRASGSNQAPQRASGSSEAPTPTRIRVSQRNTLTCDHCHAVRQVAADVYNDYISNDKRVRCRWIGYTCDEQVRIPRGGQQYQPDDISEIDDSPINKRRRR